MLRLNGRDEEAFLNKLWFQKWVCDWRGWGSDMHRLRRVLDAYATKGKVGSIPMRDRMAGLMKKFFDGFAPGLN